MLFRSAVAVGQATDALTADLEAAVGMDEAATDAAAVCARMTFTDESAAVDIVKAANDPLSSNQPSRSHRPHSRRCRQPT